MKNSELSDGQRRILQRFDEAGGVVEFGFLECDLPEESVACEQTHKQAALLFMEEVSRRSSYYQVKNDEDKARTLVGRRIDHREFLGPRYDFDREGLIVQGKGRFLNDFFFYSDPATPENIIPPDGIDYGIGIGLAYAFSAPPYRLQMTAEESGETFNKLLSFVLGGVYSNSIIFLWPTDWSNYFDDGNEWWGSFLWSFANPDTNQIAVIAASSTD